LVLIVLKPFFTRTGQQMHLNASAFALAFEKKLIVEE
jgi:hypothetical protein